MLNELVEPYTCTRKAAEALSQHFWRIARVLYGKTAVLEYYRAKDDDYSDADTCSVCGQYFAPDEYIGAGADADAATTNLWVGCCACSRWLHQDCDPALKGFTEAMVEQIAE